MYVYFILMAYALPPSSLELTAVTVNDSHQLTLSLALPTSLVASNNRQCSVTDTHTEQGHLLPKRLPRVLSISLSLSLERESLDPNPSDDAMMMQGKERTALK